MKIRKSKITILMILALGLFLFPTSHVYATENIINVSLPVTQEFKLLTQESSGIDTVGIYELKSIDSNSPMPNGSKEKSYIFQINGVDKQAILQFKYEQTGSYKYQLHQITQDRQNYIYDRSVYDLTVHIKNNENGKLIQQIILQNSNGEKCAEISFKNSCKWKPIRNEKQNTPNKNNNPRTGDESNIGIFIVMFICSFALLILFTKKRGKK